MFIRRTTYRRVLARAEAYGDAYRQACKSDRRRARLALACWRYRRELAQGRATLARQQRRIDVLQEQLDEVLGLNSEAVRAGARWQQRRTDKPRPRAEASK